MLTKLVYYWWVPIVCLDYIFTAWITQKNNSQGGYWFFAMWAFGCIPLWTVIAKYSKDVVYDGMLFDVTMTVTYTLAIMYFTKSFQKLGVYQYLGCLAILFGLFLFKKGA